ncbi:hypothetical protein CISIN_1g047698mg, partial [Citrus sinensis]
KKEEEETRKSRSRQQREMLGRVRAASSTPYDLELERMPSKLIKDDSLSIYEATLMKLKLGARRDLGPPPEELWTSHKLISRRCKNDRQLWVICKQFTSF